MLRTQKTTDILVVGLLILLLTVSFLARSPYAVKVPLRDSGIFLNIGSEILHGKILYQQTWDNKQPLLYVINALGLWFGSGSVWGVWGLELLMLVATIVASYYLIRPALTPLLAFAVITIAFLGVFPFMGGNYSEEYSVVFQLCNLSLLFGMYLPDRKPHSRSVASLGIGMLTGIVFCIKQTYLDIPITVMVYLLFLAWVEKNRRILGNLLLMGLGFLVINIPIFLYFQVNGALRDYVIDAFLLNLYYSELSSLERINSVIEKVKFIASHPFFFLTASLWLGVLVSWLIKPRQSFVRILGYPVTRRSALMVALVCLALFFVAQIVGGDPNIGFLQGRVLAIGIIFGLASIILYLRKPGSKSTEVIYKNSLHMEISRSDWHHAGAATLLFLGLVDFPLAILTISLSGKLWTHYYVTLYPAIILLLSGSLAYLSQYTETQTKRMMLKSCVLAVLVIGAIPPMLQVVGL